MALTWEKDKGAEDAALIIARLDKQVQRKPGQVSFGDLEALDNMLLLASLARLPPDIPDETRRNLVRQAISRVPADQALSPAAVLAELENAASEYLSLPRQPFVLVTTASLKLPRPSVIIPVEGSRIVLSKRLHPRFKMPETIREAHAPPGDYCAVRVHVSARCGLSGYDLGLNTLDYIRGLWNLCVNFRSSYRWSMGPKKPVNEVLLGPIQTVHRPDGTPAVPGHWSETYFYRAAPSALLVEKYAEVRNFERRMRRAVSRVTYRRDIPDLIVLYGRALDDPDMATSFFKLWVVLEQLISDLNETYRALARRASFIFEDWEYQAVVLRRLQAARNSIAHHSHTPGEAESLVFQLKQYVEWMLVFVVNTARRFQNLGEFLAFLELPRKLSELERRLDLDRMAHRMITGKKSGP